MTKSQKKLPEFFQHPRLNLLLYKKKTAAKPAFGEQIAAQGATLLWVCIYFISEWRVQPLRNRNLGQMTIM